MPIANVEQAQAWDGHEGDLWTDHADRYERSGRCQQAWFDARRFVGPTDDVLDVGCGTGHSTRAAARQAADGTATGIDLSGRMLDRARAVSEAEGLTNARYIQGDAQVHPFPPASCDVVVSAMGAQFFADPVAAFTNLRDALRPGGRLALRTWRSLDDNEWMQLFWRCLAAGRDLPRPPARGANPFGLSDAPYVHEVLTIAGFANVDLIPIDEPMDMGKDAADALDFARTTGIYEGLTEGLDRATIETCDAALLTAYQEAEAPDGVLLPAGAWCITARRP